MMLCFVSCEKDDDAVVESPKSDNVIDSKALNASRVYYDNGAIPGVEDVDYGCKSPGSDCLNTIVVSGAANHVINDIGDAGDQGDDAKVIRVVQNNLNLLSSIASRSLLNDVINSRLTLRVRGTASTTSHAYMIFSDNGNIVSVTPTGL